MNASTTWIQHRRGEPAAAEDEEPDAADLGTAFGMECSLEPHPPATPKLPPARSDAEADPAP